MEALRKNRAPIPVGVNRQHNAKMITKQAVHLEDSSKERRILIWKDYIISEEASTTTGRYPAMNPEDIEGIIPICLQLSSDSVIPPLLEHQPHFTCTQRWPKTFLWLESFPTNPTKSSIQNSSMSEKEHQQNPPIYKHLSPKTQGLLRASASHRQEAAKLHEANMSTEQTYVD